MSTIVEELSKLRSEHTVLADAFRTKQTAFSVLKADQSYSDQLKEAHSSLQKSVNAWGVARKAALDGNVKGAEEAVAESRRLLNESKSKLASIGADSVPAKQTSEPSQAASSPEPKPTPPAPTPTPPSPKNDDPVPPAQADQGKADEQGAKAIDLDEIKLREKVQAIVHAMVEPSFNAINAELDRLSNAAHLDESINALLASGEYTIEDIERSFKIGRFMNSKFKKRTRHNDEHDNHHEDDRHRDDQDQSADHDSTAPPTKAHNLGADQKAAPQHERTR